MPVCRKEEIVRKKKFKIFTIYMQIWFSPSIYQKCKWRKLDDRKFLVGNSLQSSIWQPPHQVKLKNHMFSSSQLTESRPSVLSVTSQQLDWWPFNGKLVQQLHCLNAIGEQTDGRLLFQGLRKEISQNNGKKYRNVLERNSRSTSNTTVFYVMLGR